MKLIRFGQPGQEKPGVILPDGSWRDTTAFAPDYNGDFFGIDGPARLASWVARQGAALPVVPTSTRLGPPIARPTKIVCIGLNFVDHAKESNMALPTEPILFF